MSTTASLALAVSVALAGVPSTPHVTSASAAVAAALASAAPTKESLDQLYAEAQMHVERYNATGDVEQLRLAKAQLDQWLQGHAQLYGYSDAAVQARAPVQKQVASIDQQLGTSPTPAATPAPTAVAPTPAMTPEQVRRKKRSDGMFNAGLIVGALGLSSVLFIGLPAWGLRNNALDNAREQRFHVDEQRYLDRARRRHRVMIGALAVGGAFTIGGIVLVTVGAVGRASVQREIAIAPMVGPETTGLSARLRF